MVGGKKVLLGSLRIGVVTALMVACAGAPDPAAVSPPAPLAGATQLVLVTTEGWDSTAGELRRFSREEAGSPWRAEGGPVPVVVGRAGLGWGVGFDSLATAPATAGPRKREGDGRAPAGAFPLGRAFGFAPADSLPWLRLPYLPLTQTTECVDDADSERYNQVVDRSTVPAVDWRSAERMREIALYRLGVLVEYNPASVRARGSCIFLHIWAGPRSTTAGCTAMAEAELAELMEWLDPSARAVLVQLPATAYPALRTEWRLPAPDR